MLRDDKEDLLGHGFIILRNNSARENMTMITLFSGHERKILQYGKFESIFLIIVIIFHRI